MKIGLGCEMTLFKVPKISSLLKQCHPEHSEGSYASRAPLKLTALLIALLSMDAWALADPTKPAYYAGGAAYEQQLKAQYQLSSVLVSSQRRVATINGQRVSVGERVTGTKTGSGRVAAITKEHVVLEVEGLRLKLPLASSKVIKKVTKNNVK